MLIIGLIFIQKSSNSIPDLGQKRDATTLKVLGGFFIVLGFVVLFLRIQEDDLSEEKLRHSLSPFLSMTFMFTFVPIAIILRNEAMTYYVMKKMFKCF